jgi:methyltransferase-like protein/2-polyprenyl-3-methyl-5-hydroxy-6-metoxy-1,4-benzoquinol methylase
MTNAPTPTSYDELPYDSHPYDRTHPDHLATMARLFGVDAPDTDNCRVLELGCAAGGNLIPMAASMPAAKFLGIDLSNRQIDQGRVSIQQVSLQNIELRHQSIGDFTRGEGEFDYIICHGVYSWVPPDIQDAILRICSENLSANGVAYVSYNTYPGWFMRGMVRQMMCFHARQFDDPTTQVEQARALLDFLIEAGPGNDPTYHQLLKRELEIVRNRADSYLFHEHLETHNEPLFFHQFAERAAGHDLRYLSETQLSEMIPSNYAPNVEETLQRLGSSLIHVEQYLDFLRNRTFRRTLLCHAKLEPNRELGEAQLVGMHVSSTLQPVSPEPDLVLHAEEVFRGTSGMTASVSHPILKSALVALHKSSPGTIAFNELPTIANKELGAISGVGEFMVRDADNFAADRRNLGQLVLELYTRDLVELRAVPQRFTLTISERPWVNSLVRQQADEAAWATNLRHEILPLNDLDRHLLRCLDGTNGMPELVDRFAELVTGGKLVVEHDGQDSSAIASNTELLKTLVTHGLNRLARHAFLQQPPGMV